MNAIKKPRRCAQNIDTTIRLFVKQLQAPNVELIACLKPFAALLQDHNNFDFKGKPRTDDVVVFQVNDAKITLGDLRRAVVLLAKHERGD